MVDSGRCSVIIRGNSLDFDDIAKNIAIKPSQIIRRGEKSSKFRTLNLYDIWIYDVVYENNEINKTLENLLIHFEPYDEYLVGLSHDVDVSLRCYIQSDYAEIGWSFYPELLRKLAEMKIKLEFSIFSWGGTDGS